MAMANTLKSQQFQLLTFDRSRPGRYVLDKIKWYEIRIEKKNKAHPKLSSAGPLTDL